MIKNQNEKEVLQENFLHTKDGTRKEYTKASYLKQEVEKAVTRSDQSKQEVEKEQQQVLKFQK